LAQAFLGWILPTTTIQLLAETGITLLLFKDGIETDIRRLINAGRSSMIVAMGGFFMLLISGFILSYWVFTWFAICRRNTYHFEHEHSQDRHYSAHRPIIRQHK
jgi:Kef-type K+ transport system membrane component KefB